MRLRCRRRPMILSAIAEKLKRRSKGDFKGRHFEASLILQAVCWYLRYPLSYREIEELFQEHGLAVDHATLNRWVLAYAPLIERRLRAFRKPHCGCRVTAPSPECAGSSHHRGAFMFDDIPRSTAMHEMASETATKLFLAHEAALE